MRMKQIYRYLKKKSKMAYSKKLNFSKLPILKKNKIKKFRD